MAPWLLAAVEETSGAPVGARNARPRRHRCGAIVLVGLDADLCALTATVDPVPIDAAGELAATLTGRWTYLAERSGHRVQLVRRDRWNMRTPAGVATVLAEHRCGLVLGDPIQSTPSAQEVADACPF